MLEFQNFWGCRELIYMTHQEGLGKYSLIYSKPAVANGWSMDHWWFVKS